MRKRSIFCLLPIMALASPAIAQVPATPSASAPRERTSLTDLQARFARMQQVVRPDGGAFELQRVDAEQPLLRQFDDGVVRLPEDWAAAAPDAETLDFLMLLALSAATAPEVIREGPSTATKWITGAIGFVGVNAAHTRDRQPIALGPPRFASATPWERPDTVRRALSWAVASGGCEARIVAGLRRLEAAPGEIGADSRQIVKDLGAVAWTPNDRCGRPAR